MQFLRQPILNPFAYHDFERSFELNEAKLAQFVVHGGRDACRNAHGVFRRLQSSIASGSAHGAACYGGNHVVQS